ncbi:PREDICTED: uncharacterized protein LOC107193595 [Dufourea novaeangliae]|uniref:MADF domain-containing protein n=1 Tax=Dufourea novaeangliae TaxID=178035 RepID=A0A154NZU0_DUFNO|nr:PREDICTED: uncharacterized protein LOC107193595 [Dufourea novaeangliae]KZC05113.1 hypothetical protein WN55_08720 [Dufourea novaeangliae]
MSNPDLVGYTHDFLTEFIQLYRSFPCLWQVRYKGYKDRLLRNRAYDALVQKLREVNPVADKETVIRKINTLRTAFRREYKKVRSSQRMVKNPWQRYRSSLWYYDILKFVAEQNEPTAMEEEKELVKNPPIPVENYHEQMFIQTDVDKIEPPSPVPSPEASPDPNFQPVILETEGSYARRISSSVSGVDTFKKKHQQEGFPTKESTHDVPSSRPFAACVTDDEFDTFGRYVANKLRKSMPRQGIIAEKIIADVLLRANLGTLDESTSLTEKVPSRCFLVMGDR